MPNTTNSPDDEYVLTAKIDMKTIRSIYTNKCIQYPNLKQELEYIMRKIEIELVKCNLHKSFALFSDDNVALTAPTYNCLETNIPPPPASNKFLIDLAYSILLKSITKYVESCQNGDTSPTISPAAAESPNQVYQYKYKDVKLGSTVFRKTDILARTINPKKLSPCELKLINLTPSIIKKSNSLFPDDKKFLIAKIAKLKTIYKRNQCK